MQLITSSSVVINVPQRISREHFIKVLQDAKSPAASEAGASYDVIVAEKCDPLFLLAIFKHESNFANDPKSICALYGTRSAGNCRSSTIGPQEIIQTERGAFVRYNSWQAGFQDLAHRLSTPAYVYAQKGLTTIGAIIPVFAPAEDSNDPVAYVNAIIAFMTKYQEESRTKPMATQYTIEWRAPGSPNFFPNRQGLAPNGPVAIVDHIMSGSQESSDSWFKNPASEVSAHFGVARDGRIWQWVKLEDGSWANGIVQSPDMSVPFIADAVNRGINPNDVSLSIEHEGMTGNPFPEVQYQATLWLHRYLLQKYPAIKPDRNSIVGHYQITSKDRANCPGTGFPWDRLIKDLNTLVAPVTPPVPPAAPTSVLINGHLIGGGFFSKYTQYGPPEVYGIPTFGLPLSEEYDENGKTYQDFERARFEYDPAQSDPVWRVQGWLLGVEWRKLMDDRPVKEVLVTDPALVKQVADTQAADAALKAVNSELLNKSLALTAIAQAAQQPDFVAALQALVTGGGWAKLTDDEKLAYLRQTVAYARAGSANAGFLDFPDVQK